MSVFLPQVASCFWFILTLVSSDALHGCHLYTSFCFYWHYILMILCVVIKHKLQPMISSVRINKQSCNSLTMDDLNQLQSQKSKNSVRILFSSLWKIFPSPSLLISLNLFEISPSVLALCLIFSPASLSEHISGVGIG